MGTNSLAHRTTWLRSDFPTPIVTKTHARDPVPYMIYHKNAPVEGVDTINEDTAKATGNSIEHGADIMKHFIQ